MARDGVVGFFASTGHWLALLGRSLDPSPDSGHELSSSASLDTLRRSTCFLRVQWCACFRVTFEARDLAVDRRTSLVHRRNIPVAMFVLPHLWLLIQLPGPNEERYVFVTLNFATSQPHTCTQSFCISLVTQHTHSILYKFFFYHLICILSVLLIFYTFFMFPQCISFFPRASHKPRPE